MDNDNTAAESIEEAAVRRRLAEMAEFSHERAQAARLTRLTGMTNRVYKVETGRGAFSMRIPGPGTAEIIDRGAEEHNARAAAAAGVAPELVQFGPDGVMVTRFIAGEMLLPARFRDDPTAIDRAADALLRLHHRASPFAREFHVFEIAESYVALLTRKGAPLGAEHLGLLDQAMPLRAALAARPTALRPCHCDPTGANLIDDGAKVWLIDWEYSAMNDPMWDLAYLSLEAAFDAALEERFLGAYFGRRPYDRDLARLEAFKVLCLLLSGLWARVQHASGNRSVDFAACAEATLARCRQLMSDSGLPRMAAALRKG